MGGLAADLDTYTRENHVDEVVEDMISALLKAKPDNPRQWLLERLEKDLSDQSDSLSESDLHKLFAVTRRITSEIVPKETIMMVIRETLTILNADIVSLFVLERKSGMLLLYASNLDTPIKVNPGQGIAGSVYNSQQTVSIRDCYQDRRFDRSFDKSSGYLTRSLIAVPIVDYEGTSIGVIQAINKLSTGPQDETRSAGQRAIPFERTDEKILLHLTQHVAIAMRNADVYREAISTSERATGLLNTIQNLSQDLGTQSLLLTITMHANKIVSAQRSTVFLVDDAHQQLWSVSTDTGQEIRIPKRAGIAGQCCCEGKLINIPDAYADSRFNQEVDKKTGFKTQSILAVPIFDNQADGGSTITSPNARRSFKGGGHGSEGKESGPLVVGVIQMINKVSYDGQLESFDEQDIEVMELFSKFVGPKLTNSAMLQRRGSDMTQSSEAEFGLKKLSGRLTDESGGKDPGFNGKKRGSSTAVPSNFDNFIEECEDEDDT
jgi:GAF domain-containing protein